MSDLVSPQSWLKAMTAAGTRFRTLATGRAPKVHLALHAVLTRIGPLQEQDFRLALVPAWRCLLMARKETPSLFEAANAAGTVSALLAGAYEADGWDFVVSTSPSTERDIQLTVTKHAFGSVQLLDRIATYPRGHLVTVDDLRPAIRNAHDLPSTSTAIVATTAGFAPDVHEHPLVAPLLPNRLALRSREHLLEWMNATRAVVEKELNEPPCELTGCTD